MKKIILLILILVVAGIGIGFYFYNKPVESLAGEEPVAILSADELMTAYESDETGSNGMYLGKLIQVKGQIQKLQSDTSGIVMILATSGGMFGVSCKLEPGYSIGPEIREGSDISLKGVVNGYMGDVSMNRCVLIK